MGKKGWKHTGCRHYSGSMVLSYWFRFVFSCICWCWVRYMYEMICFMTVYTKKWRICGILDEYSWRARACKRNKKRSMGYMMHWNALERWSIRSKDKYIFFFWGIFLLKFISYYLPDFDTNPIYTRVHIKKLLSFWRIVWTYCT